MTIDQLLLTIQPQLAAADIDSARLDAQLIVAHVLKQPREWLLAHGETPLTEANTARVVEIVRQRADRKPLAQLLGGREFYGHHFIVDTNVLIPRPETEVLVEEAAKHIPEHGRVLEIGTGSGCISISLALARPDVTIVATDISPKALDIARMNAQELKTSTIEFVESDLFTHIQAEQAFDAVLANLPYVPTVARRQPEIEFEPDVALYGGEDGLDYYRIFFKQLRTHLQPSGVCLVEYSPTQHRAVRELVTQYSMHSEPVTEYIYRISQA